MKLCAKIETPGQCDAILEEHDDGTFKVTYGRDISARCSYEQAAALLGGAIMHAAMCAGLIGEQMDADGPATFDMLAVGDEFDFIDAAIERTSFFDRCRKTSERRYTSIKTGALYTVGTEKCPVYHVELK
jgi:hypothetical protein